MAKVKKIKKYKNGKEAIQDPAVVDPKNRRTVEEIDNSRNRKSLLEPLCYKVIDWIKEGMSISNCKELLSQEINPRTKKPHHIRFVNEIVETANKLIKQDFSLQRSNVTGLHIQRYDKDIKALLNINVSNYLPYKQDEMKTEAFMRCLDVLQQKETLLGMHRKTFKLIINNESTIIVKEKKIKLNITKLTLQEQIELNTLLEKSRRTDDELGGVILRRDIEAEVVEDVEYEVVEERKNVDRMENRNPKPLLAPQEGFAMMNVENKLKLALQKKAQEEFKKAGSKTVDQDIIPERV